ncbi:hypothetical protein K3179_10565 [Qipengyuania sp. GH38]|uniref:reverse transcriptase domain-containing protein n=1 Tax=Qipengyuania intermedia TaxID=2867244 RepID=UPI001C873C04|nr:reverse transcriptase domain-containing protein [Qipengyuania intermedia]MBX7514983.1 hypothetical protein [Qipengyuania intermedia]
MPANLRKIQTDLREGYSFEAPYGATPDKGPGKAGKRPIVVAPIRDRIVQRAILDILQTKSLFPKVSDVLNTPTSIGGIPGRGVDHAIRLFSQAVEDGATYVMGSDIGSFFTKIDQTEVTAFLRKAGVGGDLLGLVSDALRVELRNSKDLSEEDRALFPTGTDGVAQGSPLSALAGNIVLHDFDQRMNERGIICIRYIDDFLLCGARKDAVKKAMLSAKAILSEKGMTIYDACEAPNKAFAGSANSGQVFLGYKLIPGEFPPSDASCEKLMENIQAELASGRATIGKVLSGRTLNGGERAFVQTLAQVDRIIRGWRESHKMSDCPEVYSLLDKDIDHRINAFMRFYREKAKGRRSSLVRMAMGVSPLVR